MTQAESQIEYILTNAGARVIFISNKMLYDRVEPILHRLSLDHIVVFGGLASGHGVVGFHDLLSRGNNLDKEQPGLFGFLRRNVGPETVASVIYTSGTTGEPKGVVLTHRNLTSNAVNASSVIELHAGSDIALSFLPPLPYL